MQTLTVLTVAIQRRVIIQNTRLLIKNTLLDSMKPEQLEAIRQEITTTIKLVVNGKIDRITEKLDNHMDSAQSHWEKSNSFMTEMVPLQDALHTVQSLNKFIKWLGIPSLLAFITYLFVK